MSQRVAGQSSPWHDPTALLSGLRDDSISVECDWYRIADVNVGIESDDLPLRLRFRELYGECLSQFRALAGGTQLLCSVRSRDDSRFKVVTFTGPERLNIVDFILSMFRDRGYELKDLGPGEWQFLGLQGSPSPFLAARENVAVVDETQPWQPAIANCTVNWAMRLQPEMLFFHAAAVGVKNSGVVITGAKGAGKSTLSLALAAQGHDLLADEIAAVRKRSYEVVPLRKALSIRQGPQAAKVEERLRQNSFATEPYPDGTTRVRAEAGEFFPGPAPKPVPLRCVFFLREFTAHPRVESVVPGMSELRLLAPLACTYWGASPAAQMVQVAKLLSNVRCYFLHPGMPDDTAGLIEEIVEAL